jgi:hypothetical protein
MTLLPV